MLKEKVVAKCVVTIEGDSRKAIALAKKELCKRGLFIDRSCFGLNPKFFYSIVSDKACTLEKKRGR